MIEIHSLTKKYGKNIVLNGFNCKIPDTGITALSGSSGIGKTTFIRILTGLEKSDSGKITGLNSKKISVMFQEDRLFEHLTALENVSIVSDEKTATELLTKFGLSDKLNEKPSLLSGGMCRRVSLARALAFGGDILILDEPFKGLDNELKNEIMPMIKKYSNKHCVIIITHDSEDLASVDNIIYM